MRITILLGLELLLVALFLVSGNAFRRGLISAVEDLLPVEINEVNATTHWRFITAEWPLSFSGSRTWGYAAVHLYPTKKCEGEAVAPEKVVEGGGNWTNGIVTGSESDDYDYADYDANLHDDDYWNNDFAPADGEGYKKVEEDAGSLYDNYDIEYEDDETENFDSSLGSWALYKLMPSKSCLDPTIALKTKIPGYAGCQKACTQVDNCKAFTYNLESSKCFLKEACLRLRNDRSANDISGVFLRDLRNAKAPKNGTGESTGETEGTENEDGNEDGFKYVKTWEERTISVTDSPLGGAFIEAIFSDPALIQCVQIIVPPRLKAKFPQAARLQFSMDNGVSWKTAQALEPIGQEELLVKTITGHATTKELKTRFDKLKPGAPPAEKGYVRIEALAEAVSAAMQAVSSAAEKGVQFKSPAAGIFFTLGMMLIGAILSWCISACCCRRWRSKEVAYSDLSAENGLSKLASLELAPSSTADKQS